MIEKLSYGVCFYPEHWPLRTAVDDVKRIADCGFDFVRIGEGAWWYFEPAEGQYQFDLFDQVIDECRRNNLRVVFGTPTYTGPAWIGHTYPDVYRHDFNRVPMKHGSRRNFNYTSPNYLRLCDGVVQALADHYKNEQQIFSWQIDNEFNCHMDVSYAPSDTLAFRVWLKNRYKTINGLNDAWGTKFWSQVYNDWEQIDLPHPTATFHNPTHKLDESRFISDTVVAFCARQANILRAANPAWRITHNGLFTEIDGPKLVEQLDYWSHDQYPLFYSHWTHASQPLVQSRSLSFPYGVLEQQAGPGGQMVYLLRTPRPGEMRLFAHQSFAHGAKLLSYFCWRTLPFGSEQHWHGLLDHDGKDNRRIAEAKQVGKEIRSIPAEFWDAPPVRTVAVLRDFDNETNERRINTYVKGGWDPGFWMNAFFRRHIPIDQVWPGSEWDGYRVLIAPHLKIVDAAMVEKYEHFVRAGGTLVLMAQSGIKNQNLHMVQQTAPGLLRKLAGVEVADWTTLKAEENRTAVMENGTSLVLTSFVEKLKLKGAAALATWDTDDTLLTGGPAVTLNKVGNGQVMYVGGYFNEATAGTLADWLTSELQLTPPVQASADVEVLDRRSKKSCYLYLLNHSTDPQFIEDVPPGHDFISGRDIDGTLKLQPFDVAIIKTK